MSAVVVLEGGEEHVSAGEDKCPMTGGADAAAATVAVTAGAC